MVIGFIGGLPVYEERAIVHDPATGRFTSGGSGGSAGRNKLMAEHAGKQAHPEAAIKEAIHHLADKGSKVGKADAHGKSAVHIDGEHVGHISTESHGGVHIVHTGKISSGKTAGSSITTAHHVDGSTTTHNTKKDAIRELAEHHFHGLSKQVEHEAASKHAEAASKSAHKASEETKEFEKGSGIHSLAHKDAASRHEFAAYYHEKAGNHEKAAEHKATAAHHKKEAEE